MYPDAQHEADETVASVAVVSLSPAERDHRILRSLLPAPQFTVHCATALSVDVMALLRRGGIHVVLCEGDVEPGAWKEVLDFVMSLPHPPFLIVTSRTGSEALWAEALNLGARDVLAKPFDRTELIRVLGSAWLHWQEQYASAKAGAGSQRARAAN
ncbi:MAG TPA: hypothetical protein VMU19_13705 [Bryobacteraceae bacterium]|nr:hypothetical protein [Bryobacteraceae bacterium]